MAGSKASAAGKASEQLPPHVDTASTTTASLSGNVLHSLRRRGRVVCAIIVALIIGVALLSASQVAPGRQQEALSSVLYSPAGSSNSISSNGDGNRVREKNELPSTSEEEPSEPKRSSSAALRFIASLFGHSGGGETRDERRQRSQRGEGARDRIRRAASAARRRRLASDEAAMRTARRAKEKNYFSEAFTEDYMVREKFEAWERNGSVRGEEVWKGRTFFDPTPHISPKADLAVYPYLKHHVDEIMPLYPRTLRDYRHTYGNCRGNHRHSTSYGDTTVRMLQKGVGGVGGLGVSNSGGAAAGGGQGGGASAQDSKVVPEDNPDTFTRLWPHIPDRRLAYPTEHERCHAVMVRQLAILTSVLEHNNLTNWFISHATLLGAVRHGGMIPWDVDVDVVMTRSTARQLRRIWRREFPRDMFLQSERTDPSFKLFIGDDRGARIKDRYSGFHGFEFVHYHHKTRKKKRLTRYQFGAGVDIIPINRVPLKNVPNGRDRMKVFHSYFNASDVFPTTKICFENFEVRAPKDPEWFLDLIYGAGGRWRELPEHPILAAPTALPCVSTTPLWGSAWNLKWELDHPLAANKTVINEAYEPFEASAEEEAEAEAAALAAAAEAEKTAHLAAAAAKTKGNASVANASASSVLAPKSGDPRVDSPAPSSTANSDEEGDVPLSTTTIAPASGADKPPTRYPRVGAKLFPRSDPHGTHWDDMQRPYMKYHRNMQPRYGTIENKDERARGG